MVAQQQAADARERQMLKIGWWTFWAAMGALAVGVAAIFVTLFA